MVVQANIKTANFSSTYAFICTNLTVIVNRMSLQPAMGSHFMNQFCTEEITVGITFIDISKESMVKVQDSLED